MPVSCPFPSKVAERSVKECGNDFNKAGSKSDHETVSCIIDTVERSETQDEVLKAVREDSAYIIP